MVDQKDPNKKHYFQLASYDEFVESVKIQCKLEDAPPVTIWEKGENEEDAELYKPVEFDPEGRILKLKATGKLLTQITGSLKAGKHVLVKIPIEERLNYFASGKLSFDPNAMTYSLELTREIYKSQARGNYRLSASKAIPIQFKIDNQVFDALDVSVSGTSFAINPEDSERFAKGSNFCDCTLRFDRKNYHIPIAQVAIQLPLNDEAGTPTGKIKVGIAFKDLPSKTEDELYIKVSTEARGEEMKKKFDTVLAKKTSQAK
jgi:hypothetical protein